ncbi:MAG: septal ring factor EnvC (AmiA/AmiB activator) [Polaribacter sp.]
MKNKIMGLFWDLIQQSEITEQGEKAANLEQRVAKLENDLSETQQLLRKTLISLEKHLGKDIDGDGELG